MLRVALIGCGLISESHIQAYRHHAGRARITVCCDIDAEKAGQRAHEAGGEARATTSYADVLADPDVDAVEILTPHHLHSEAVLAAAQAGKHILCQKPLAKTIAECDAMIAAARAAGVVLFYGEITRTMPAAVAAKQAIAAGRIGQPVGFQATYAHWQGGAYLRTAWRYDPSITGGGQLLDGGIHYLDMLLNIGGPIERVSCMATRFRPELGGEDTAVVNLRYAAGQLGTLFSSQAAGVWFPGASFVAFGTEGVLALNAPAHALTLHRADLHGQPEVVVDKPEGPFTAMIGSYLDTVLDGAPNPAPAEVGRENLRIVLAAYESVRRGGEVGLDEIAPAWG